MLLRSSATKLPRIAKSFKPSTIKLSSPPVRNMAFFPRFADDDFAPIFRLLDDYDAHRSTYRKQNHNHNQHTSVRSFAPRFDVRELNDSYRLDGELPGIDQNNIDIEFTDPHTLVVKGRIERESHDSNLPQNRIESASDEEEGTAAPSSKPRQPTVEDDTEENAGASGTTTAVTAPTSSSSEVTQTTTKPAFKYWISERSIGEFHRTFSFPTRIDQDAVRASLKNGILSIVVPKAPAPKVKKVRIE